ncbi:hypothetical protein S7335_4597 [Synechococcus sp. PCC 7335]|uniref:hypothetical protein n=1 Tax=Synechococcus sp. (strain ATCC 29403 / PCC 7335) TaxID=91464 RepID=UPI00017ED21B|nr:hypothetical protein [Synechococcus sp. PCC 7335]EDX86890.1 hypothetical protein S7335_4597 [Synechococcus sp. PCC 7335]
MKDTKNDPKLKTVSVDEGWSVHVYDRDRRLCCTLDASHARTFVVGLGMGLLFSIVGMRLVAPQTTSAAQSSSPNLSKVREAPRPTDLSTFVPWID